MSLLLISQWRREKQCGMAKKMEQQGSTLMQREQECYPRVW